MPPVRIQTGSPDTIVRLQSPHSVRLPNLPADHENRDVRLYLKEWKDKKSVPVIQLFSAGPNLIRRLRQWWFVSDLTVEDGIHLLLVSGHLVVIDAISKIKQIWISLASLILSMAIGFASRCDVCGAYVCLLSSNSSSSLMSRSWNSRLRFSTVISRTSGAALE